MLIQFEKSTRGAYGATSDSSRLDVREGASRNPAIQLRAASSIRHGPAVAQSRSEETTVHPFLSTCCAALIDIAALLSAILLVSATGVGIAFAVFVLLFMPL
ncbi:MAG: hypothetical protein M9932_04270 [Xanthobacteraceae bacterium]|nr:hypothetical protein [Xanthobacteraceae bacterium]